MNKRKKVMAVAFINLFSEKPMLYETYGADYLNGELIKKAKTYQAKLMRSRKK